MTNKNKLVESINNDFDKQNNYNSIMKKVENNHSNNSYLKFTVIPINIILIIAIVAINNKNDNQIKAFKNRSNVNTTSSQNDDDYDGLDTHNNIIINEIDEIANNSYDMDFKIQHGVYIPYFEILLDLKVPSDFDNKEDMRAIWVKSNPNSNDYDILNNYELHLRNTKNNRELIISFSNKYKILRCVNPFVVDHPKSSINGVELPIVKGRNYYISAFSYNGYNFDIEGIEVTQEEYINLLESLIK